VSDAFDLIIIGGGSAGLTAAQAALALGARTALVEGKRTGGECTWTGCIPSKTLLSVAHQAHAARNGQRFGIHSETVTIDFAQVMTHLQQTIHDIYHEESPDALRQMGLDVFEAYARFSDPHTLELSDGKRIHGRRFILCTGAQTVIPPVFASVPCLTNETLFDLETLPEHLIIVGAGAVGCEMAQAFRRLGAQVTLLEAQGRILPNVDEEAAQIIYQQFAAEGIHILTNCTVQSASAQDGQNTLQLADGTRLQGDHVLLATGKRPSFTNLGLDAAGIQVSNGQLVLDDRLRTTQRHILAAGDITGGAQYTHYAGWQAFIAVRNALLPALLGGRGVRAWTPYAMFTDPEIAQAGLTEAQAQFAGKTQVTRLPITRADRAMTEGKRAGFMKLIHLASGKLLGATLVGYSASEMINDWIAVLERGGSVSSTASAMRAYPSMGTANVIVATEQTKAWLKSGTTGALLRGLARFSW
jgi:pyruvate/2-oxoglutarate dehydrogenase complex dihydrolipoamide dehydrogenase (E3) component